MATANEFSDFPEVGQSSSQAASEFADFPEDGGQTTGPRQYGTLGEQASAGLEAGAGAAVEMSGLIPGAMLGAKAGTAAAPFLGPFAPAAPIIGGVVGALGGVYAGGMAREGLGLRRPEQFEPGLRPGAYTGEAFGGALPTIAAPYAAAVSGYRFGPSTVGNFLNQIINTAQTQPIRFGAAEVAAAASAAGAAGVAEVVAPGNVDVRVNAELAGGVLNPTRLAISGSRYVWNTGKNVITSIGPAGRETAAARILADLTSITNEDPAILAKILRDQGIVGATNVTAAQKTGSPALGALEDHLAKASGKFGKEAEDKARDALDAIRGQITLLRSTGDPAALTAAAEARNVYYRTLIQGRLDSATETASVFARGINVFTPENKTQIGIKARDALNQAITDSRRAETDLWNKVDGTRKVAVSNLQRTYDEVSAELLPEVRNEKLPPLVRKFLDRVNKPGEPSFDYDPQTLTLIDRAPDVGTSNVKEMRQLRSELLDLARTSTNAGEFGQARIYNNLAESVLDDMDAAFAQAGDTAYDEARAFSREFNDVFTRSFAGRATATGKYGDRIAPELLMVKALASGKEAGAIQMQELEEATRFMVTKGLGTDEAMRQMLDAQESMLRLAAADAVEEIVDPKTGERVFKANPARLKKFLKDNKLLMDRFPEVRTDINAAILSEEARDRMVTLARGQVSVMEKKKTFGKILGSDPVTMATRALMSPTREEQIVAMLNVAKPGVTGKLGRQLKVSPDALKGATASVYEAALRQSTDRNGVLNIAQMKGFLFDAYDGQKSVIQILQEQGAVDAATARNMRTLFDTAEAIQRSQRPGTAIDVKTDLTDAAIATIARMVGSGAAGAGARAVGSTTPSLIVHGAGARLAETAMTKIPTQKSTDLLIQAANDPEFMARLLEKASKIGTDKAKAAQARQIHAWLVQSGLTSGQEAFRPTYEQEQRPEFFSAPR